ncbi:hypothetical protein SK128_001726 [Halocaridina rubra]|uniref:B box-type domain-containing protein n=1 Tax=Halocaridina rubra TaxID=373956 RepID=A0AAN8WTF0_HALRR
MEVELRCPHCSGYYHVPVLLFCHHALCLSCAAALQKPASLPSHRNNDDVNSPPIHPAGEEVEETTSEVDKVSVLSDADSGVSCSSRPTSLVGASEGGGGNCDPPPPLYTIVCPRCGVITPIRDESGAKSLSKYRVLAAVVDKHLEKNQVAEPCQLCDGGPGDQGARPTQVFCDQCLVFYCGPCRDNCHPARGPLATHWLVSVAEGRALLRARRREREGRCSYHPQEHVTMYCLTCRGTVCVLCLTHGRHHAHDIHALNAITKTHKITINEGYSLAVSPRGSEIRTDWLWRSMARTKRVLPP